MIDFLLFLRRLLDNIRLIEGYLATAVRQNVPTILNVLLDLVLICLLSINLALVIVVVQIRKLF